MVRRSIEGGAWGCSIGGGAWGCESNRSDVCRVDGFGWNLLYVHVRGGYRHTCRRYAKGSHCILLV